ncbi:hypothetical protein CCACVL1_10028 [Corchorus capsularis]|uniref:Uncharacterized protein n=1 Tax=Corchorus capsularis TaxID=210143 RepID=A0A1R3IT44_COCAP|nr:hypothetical protein CCACVL1_10028 [Corchorus capsularis]
MGLDVRNRGIFGFIWGEWRFSEMKVQR